LYHNIIKDQKSIITFDLLYFFVRIKEILKTVYLNHKLNLWKSQTIKKPKTYHNLLWRRQPSARGIVELSQKISSARYWHYFYDRFRWFGWIFPPKI